MAVEGQTSDFRDLAAERAKENSQMDESLKKIIDEVQQLSDTNESNDDMDAVLGDNFDANLNITEEQVRTLTKELGRLENKYKDKPEILQQVQDLTSLLEGKIDGEQRRQSFNKLNGLIPDNLPRLKQELSSQDKRNIEKFIKSPTNTNQVMEMYLRMLSVQIDSDLPGVGSGDKKVFRKIKGWIEEKYNDEAARGQWELDNKIFTENFFSTWIEQNPDWDGSDVDNDTRIKEMNPGPHMFSSEQFKEKFASKNQERKTNNETKLGEVDIKTKVDMTKITKKTATDGTVTVYFDNNGTKEELKQDTFMNQLGITAESIGQSLTGTLFVGDELNTAVNGKKEAWFTAIANEATPEPDAPQVESLETSDIHINLFNNISVDDVKSAVDAAIANLSAEGLDQTAKETFAARIKEVTDALKDGGQEIGRGRKPGHENIKSLQEKMNTELGLSKQLIPDGKLGQYTFYAMKKYMGIETTKQDDLQYEIPGWTLGGELTGMRTHIDDAAYLKDHLHSSSDDLGELQQSAEAYMRDPLKYVKDKLDGKLGTCEVPGKDILKSILSGNSKNKIKFLQFALLPSYKGKIDGVMGPSTKRALQEYVEKSRGSNKTDTTIKSLGGSTDTIITDIESWDQDAWDSVMDGDAGYDATHQYDNVLLNNTINFFDKTTIKKLKVGTEKIGGVDVDDCLSGIVDGKKYLYYGGLYNSDGTAASPDDKTKYETHFGLVDTSRL